MNYKMNLSECENKLITQPTIDIYVEKAMALFNVKENEVTKEMRCKAKCIFYGEAYSSKCAANIGVECPSLNS